MSEEHLKPYLELEGVCPDPVFIIGSPRSGTTALGHMLNEHPELWASKESYVLHQLYGLGRAGHAWSYNQQRKNPSWLRAQDVERTEFLGFLGLGLNALYSSRATGRRWVDPTPLNTLMVDDLADMFPGASFVHLLRDGRAVVRSMGGFLAMLEDRDGPIPDDEMPKWTHDFRDACETWTRYVETARRFENSNGDRCLTVRNEDLASDPQAALAAVQQFLGIGADDGPARLAAGNRINSSFAGVSEPGEDPSSGWDVELRRQFAEIAGPTMAWAGYATADELERWSEAPSS